MNDKSHTLSHKVRLIHTTGRWAMAHQKAGVSDLELVAQQGDERQGNPRMRTQKQCHDERKDQDGRQRQTGMQGHTGRERRGNSRGDVWGRYVPRKIISHGQNQLTSSEKGDDSSLRNVCKNR